MQLCDWGRPKNRKGTNIHKTPDRNAQGKGTHHSSPLGHSPCAHQGTEPAEDSRAAAECALCAYGFQTFGCSALYATRHAAKCSKLLCPCVATKYPPCLPCVANMLCKFCFPCSCQIRSPAGWPLTSCMVGGASHGWPPASNIFGEAFATAPAVAIFPLLVRHVAEPIPFSWPTTSSCRCYLAHRRLEFGSALTEKRRKPNASWPIK